MVVTWYDYEGLEHQETFKIGDAMGMLRLTGMIDHGIRFSVAYSQCAPYRQSDFE